MKSCPNCDELLGDSVKVCIKRRYDFERKRVVTNDELIEKRNREIEQQQNNSVQKALNEWSEKGWKLHTIFTNEIGKCSTSSVIGVFGLSINATINQTVLVFERCIKA